MDYGLLLASILWFGALAGPMGVLLYVEWQERKTDKEKAIKKEKRKEKKRLKALAAG